MNKWRKLERYRWLMLLCDVLYLFNSKTLDLRSIGRSIPTATKLHNNLGQVVHTNVPLSPSSITWYWSKDGDVLRLGRWQQAWQKVIAADCRGWLKKSRTGWLPEHRDQLRAQRSVTSMGEIYLLHFYIYLASEVHGNRCCVGSWSVYSRVCHCQSGYTNCTKTKEIGISSLSSSSHSLKATRMQLS